MNDAFDTILNPAAAFERIHDRPTWGGALLTVFGLSAIGFAIERPVTIHVGIGTLAHLLATSPAFAGFDDAQRARMLETAAHPTMLQTALAFVQTFAFAFVSIMLNALFMLLASTLGGGRSGFRELWAGSVRVAIPTLGIMSIVTAIACAVAGPDAFSSAADMVRATPNVGTLVPDVHGFLGAALGALNVFLVWGLVLNALMLRHLAGVRGNVAWLAPAAMALGGILLTATLATAITV